MIVLYILQRDRSWLSFYKNTPYSLYRLRKIRQIQNVGLAYYAIPSKLLAWAVDKLTDTNATKRFRYVG